MPAPKLGERLVARLADKIPEHDLNARTQRPCTCSQRECKPISNGSPNQTGLRQFNCSGPMRDQSPPAPGRYSFGYGEAAYPCGKRAGEN